MKIEEPVATLEFDPAKVEAAYEELVEVFRKYKLRVGEILIAYGNLGYTLGASVEGYKSNGPSVEDLQKLYYSRPSPGVGLMLQGITITTWYDQYANTKIADNKDNKENT